MKKNKKTFLPLIVALLVVSVLCFFTDSSKPDDPVIDNESVVQQSIIDENGTYTSKQDVALYLYTYNKLPHNYISKSEAKKLGWVAEEGNLWQVSDHKSIGGDVFSNYEGLLPKADGRKYYECDIDYQGGARNGKRIIYSNDGLIYYTDDHYQSFELLYGGD